jgi:hypothetical protein
MTAESSESVDPLSVEDDGVIRDVAFVRFTMNGKVDALDVLRRPIHELCGHSMAKWDAIQERLTADAKLVLMSHGQDVSQSLCGYGNLKLVTVVCFFRNA